MWTGEQAPRHCHTYRFSLKRFAFPGGKTAKKVFSPARLRSPLKKASSGEAKPALRIESQGPNEPRACGALSGELRNCGPLTIPKLGR